MRKLICSISVLFILISWPGSSSVAQRTFWSPGEDSAFAIEISLENTDLKRLPIYQNSIQSLVVEGDHILGGTSAKEGLTPYLFVASLSQRELIHIEDLNNTVSGQQSIQSGFCRGQSDNEFYAGTIANKESGEDGHLIQITVDTEGAVEVEDLGAPVSGEGVFSLTCNAEGTMLFGISYPTGLFFSYSLETGQVNSFDDIVPTDRELGAFDSYSLKPEDYLGAALIEANNGIIYGSKGFNEIFSFNPEDQSFHILEDRVPEVWGRTSLGQIESWVKTDDGTLYGGNAGEGQLFRVNPSTNHVKNLGKPIMMHGLPGLAIGADDKIYGIAGVPPGYAHLFSYDSNDEGFRDYGNPQFPMDISGIEEGISWRAYNIGAVTSSKDGKYIVMGEDESLSQLLIFTVES